MIKRLTEVTPAHAFFDEELPFFVNRVWESFDLHYHEHEFTEICYVGEGSGFHHIGDETIAVRKGDLFIVPLGTSHVFRPGAVGRDHQLVVYNFIFVPSKVAESINGFPGLSELANTLQLLNLIPGPADWQELRDSTGAFHTILTSAYHDFEQRQSGFEARMYGWFILLLTEIERQLRLMGEEAYVGQTNPLSIINQAITLIHNRYGSSLTAALVAGELGISERHLHRLFVKVRGITFNQYVQNTRIERSCELLRTTKWSISEIAEAVGYQDKGYFLKLFKRKMGQSPRAYRYS